MATDYYGVLGVGRGASKKEIRSAYRRLARKFHPDVNPNDDAAEARFKEINAANEVLSDVENRKKYDDHGDNWQHADEIERAQRSGRGGRRYSFTSAGPTVGLDDEIDLGDLLGGVFGRRGETRRTRPEAATQPVEISLEEAASGITRILVADGDQGESRRLEVRIPPGVETGSRVRIAGEGRAGFDGRRGDLHLIISVRNDERFERKGNDLHTVVDAPLTMAVLGGEIEVQALNRKVALKLPPLTQNERVFRLNGLGMPHLNAPKTRGDLFTKVRVRLPEELSDDEKELFEQLKAGGL